MSSNFKPIPIAKRKQTSVTVSYADLLSCDNSLIMDFDIDKIEEETSELKTI